MILFSTTPTTESRLTKAHCSSTHISTHTNNSYVVIIQVNLC